MNSLQIWISETFASPRKVMNFLQEQGIISDNCVNPEDVAPVDADRAVVGVLRRLDKYLKERQPGQIALKL